ncbi:MAG: trypsin-like peptidase domain-containing protein [Saprospiraceae bacterium]|jgi:S1-C subfamily serine protease|nr:trypsin-like peptidase domain-containing protein [Saprospiraceae bacterium]
MKNLLVNLCVAIVSTTLTFYLLEQKTTAKEVATETIANVQLVKQEKETPINQKPRDWTNQFYTNDFVSVSKAATAAVVNITAYSTTGYRLSSGSGVIIEKSGYIVTNFHVVEDGSNYEIALSDKRKLEARLVGADPTTDLALLKVSGDDLVAIPFGNSDEVEVGEWVLAIGNPLNLTSTVTAGIVSAKARNINILRGAYSIESFIQTDAVVNPGNSGGALANTRGELVGINTAIISESGGYEGYSFAIPSNLVKKVIADLKDYGKVKRAVLGVTIGEVTERLASENGMPDLNGVVINNVTRGGSAASAGIQRGDIITAVNGISTTSVPELQEQVARYRPGDRISVEFYRQGKKYRKSNIELNSIPLPKN